MAKYQEIDPIKQIKDKLISKKYATKAVIEKIDQDVKARVKECVDIAENSPFPDSSELWKHIYKQEDYPFIKE